MQGLSDVFFDEQYVYQRNYFLMRLNFYLFLGDYRRHVRVHTGERP